MKLILSSKPLSLPNGFWKLLVFWRRCRKGWRRGRSPRRGIAGGRRLIRTPTCGLPSLDTCHLTAGLPREGLPVVFHDLRSQICAAPGLSTVP